MKSLMTLLRLGGFPLPDGSTHAYDSTNQYVSNPYPNA